MSEFLTYHEIDAATDAVRARITTTPEIALFLGPGWENWLIPSRTQPSSLPRDPFWPSQPFLVTKDACYRRVGRQTVLVLQGRTHYYEGHPVSKIGLPIG
jgi:purine nucleoside phosphorylase